MKDTTDMLYICFSDSAGREVRTKTRRRKDYCNDFMLALRLSARKGN